MELNSVNNFNYTSKTSYSTYISLNAAKGLQDVMEKNLGPKGTFKILVSSSGEIKLTKDGSLLLKEMQIQNPVALLIARSILNQTNYSGDGTTSITLILGELFRNIEKYLEKNIHPQLLCEGIDIGKRQLELFVNTQSVKFFKKKLILFRIARSIFGTKLKPSFVNKISKIAVEAVLTICREKEVSDLNLIEILQMEGQNELESRFVRGLVLDHGSRHPDMPKIMHNVFILVCNISLEYEKSEINSSFNSVSCDQQEKLFNREREVIDKKVNKIIQLKRLVCRKGLKGFLVINQKGIDNVSLDLFCKEGILALRRAKKKNMERISVLCNSIPVNSVDDIDSTVLGFAGLVYEQMIGEEKFTFIENVSNPFSGTILIKGSNLFLRKNTEEVIKNGIKALKMSLEDRCCLRGAGYTETKGSEFLLSYSKKISGGLKYGIQALAQSLLAIPETLNKNEGKRDIENRKKNKRSFVEKKVKTEKVYDCFSSKKQIYNTVCSLACQILLIDEILLGKGIGS